jgi:hypothetical protein
MAAPDRMRQGGGGCDGAENQRWPPWLKPLLGTSFFGQCKLHADAHKSECNMYCLDCMNGALCSQCLAYHRDHHAIQVSTPRWGKKWHFLASDWSSRRRALSLKETAAPAGAPASIQRLFLLSVSPPSRRLLLVSCIQSKVATANISLHALGGNNPKMRITDILEVAANVPVPSAASR